MTTSTPRSASHAANSYIERNRLHVLKKAPNFDPVMRRLGFSLLGIGRKQEGMALLERAVKNNRSPENLIRALIYLIHLRFELGTSPLETLLSITLSDI